MSQQMADRFIAALRTLEADKDVEPLAALYAEDSKIGNVIAPDRFQGTDGARQFWMEYRGTFDEAESKFRNVVASEGLAALEWNTEGTGHEGSPFRYAGVTILEVNGDLIARSSAYFDPSALGRQIED